MRHLGWKPSPKEVGGGIQQGEIPALLGQELQRSKVTNGGGKTHPSSSEWEGRVRDDAGKRRVKSNWRNQYWERTEGGHRTQEEIN